MQFWCIIYQLSLLSLQNIRTPHGNALEYNTIFRAFTIDERLNFLFVNMFGRFEVMHFQLTAGRRKPTQNLRFLPHQFFTGGEINFQK